MRLLFTILLSGWLSGVYSQNINCNQPLVANGYVVDKIDPGLASLLTSQNSLNLLLDQDLNNYTQLDLTAVVLGASIVSVKKVDGYFSSGKKVGFVFEVPPSLLKLDLLTGLSIRTYRNNVHQETVALNNNSGLVNLSVLDAGDGGKKNIEIITSKDFDEVELVKTGVVSALDNFKLYYAYVSDSTCDNNCIRYVNTDNYPGVTVVTNTFSNPNNVVNPNENLFAQRIYIVSGGNAFIRLNTPTVFPEGTQVGFEITESGLLDLVSLNLFSGITITTYNTAGVLQDSVVASNGLANVGLLSSGRIAVSIKATSPFSSMKININPGVSITTTYRVFNAFVVLDSDKDGVPNCIDRCIGNDNIINENGIPTACKAICNLYAGADLSVCPDLSDGSAQLSAIGTGYTWSALGSNPSAATINSSGLVQNMQVLGIYKFVVSNSICSDTVQVNFQSSAVDATCNRSLVGPNVILGQESSLGGICLLCNESGAQNVIDGNLNNYLQYNQLLSLLNPTSLIMVKDTSRVYTSGNRVGFVVSFPDGLLSANLLSAIQIRTYLDGNLQEIATSGSLLNAGVLAGVGNKSRVGFVSTQPFNEVELIVGDVLGLLTTIRVHNAFVEPSSCENYTEVGSDPSANCFEVLTVDTIQNTQVNYDKTGFYGAACVLCRLDSISHVIDKDYLNYAHLKMTVGALTNASISVRSKKVYTPGYEAGFAISSDPSLLDVGVLTNFAIVTYLNGFVQDSVVGNSGLLSVSLLPGSTSKSFVGFRSTKSFNEIRLVVKAPVAANVISDGLNIYYAYTRLDSDGDGIPDCMDKCCIGSDLEDADGDGYSDACDINIKAEDDSYQTLENTVLTANVLSNDELGYHGINSFAITSSPTKGEAVIDQNGTPDDLTDDFIVYTPDSNFYGLDSFVYTICDSFNVCDDGVVYVNVQQDMKAANDSVQISEDQTIELDVLANDYFGVNGAGQEAITIISAPHHGTATVLDQGTASPLDDKISYVPDDNFSGEDSLVYQICDINSICKTAVVYFQIDPANDAPLTEDDYYNVSQGITSSLDVLANDSDSLDFEYGGIDTSSLAVIISPLYGEAIVNSNGTISYTPNQGYQGVDSFTYRICDIGYPLPSMCSEATVMLEVIDGLYAENDSISTLEDVITPIDVLQNDLFGPAGPKPGPIMITVAPQNGTASVNNNNTPNDPLDDIIVYQPSQDYNGIDSLVYQICDITDNCKTATVYIELQAVNDRPKLNADFAVLPSSGYVSVDVLANDNDNADGSSGGLDISSLRVVNQPMYGNAIPNTYNGHIIYTGTSDEYGFDTVYYSISDFGFPLPVETDTSMLVIQFGQSDLSPSIMIYPSIVQGVSTIEVIIEAHELGNAPTDGSSIFLKMPVKDYMTINYQSGLQNLLGYTLNNSDWQYIDTYAGFHVFKYDQVIPANGTQVIGFTATFDPMGSNGSEPVTISIQGGGESNLNNNTDVETLKFFGN